MNLAEETPSRHFQCGTCQRAFTRADHLTRHVRAHTRQKPYTCPVCSKGFARVDLLKRHVDGHAANEATKGRKIVPVRTGRVVQACEACSQQHLRCEDEKPCSRCRKKGATCRIPAMDSVDEADAIYAAQDLLGLSNNEPLNNRVHEQLDRPTSDLVRTVYSEEAMGSFEEMTSINNAMTFASNQLRQLSALESTTSGTATPRGIMDLSFDWDVGLNDMDMGFLHEYNLQVPFNAETPSSDVPLQPFYRSELPQSGVAVRHEAFKKSVWRYLPQRHRDFGASEEPNLALADNDNSNDQHRSAMTSRRAIQERLDQVTRDKLMALVLGTCVPANITRIASGFPSVELLDGLMQYFLTSPSIDAKSWFHLPTFSPSKLKPELLAGIIAAGAVSTPDIPLRKLGFAIHEASRIGLARGFEEDNSSIRDLQHLQCFMLNLDIGMWSGISRKMEIAESFLQPLVTMLRRGGRFRRTTWKQIEPKSDDDDVSLEGKWQAWVLQETYLRLVYRTFEHDRQSSLALLKPPLISYSEMQLPLPHSDVLWHASSSESWRLAFLANPPPEVIASPIHCLKDLEHLVYYQSANFIYLYMMWGLVWEYRQMAALVSHSPQGSNSSLILSSIHQDLTKRLEDFRLGNTSIDEDLQNHSILLEIMLLHLNVSVDDMQLFAGIDGQEEARSVDPRLKIWVGTPSARQALCHAGQIFRASAAIPHGRLRNFNAIAIYHAGLIVWSYGFLRDRPPSVDVGTPSLAINGQDHTGLRRFITLGRGTPTLQTTKSDRELVAVSNIPGAMDILLDLLRTNHDVTEGSCPPLVDNLIQLIEGLKSAAQ